MSAQRPGPGQSSTSGQRIRWRAHECVHWVLLRIAKTLGEAAQALRDGPVPHGKCGEMLGYAQQLPAVLGDVIG